MINDKTVITSTIDWLQFTTEELWWPIDWDAGFKEQESGRWGYTQSRSYPDGRFVLVNPKRPEMGTHCVLSGGALTELYRRYRASPATIVAGLTPDARVTRIDVAVDVKCGYLDFDEIVGALQAQKALTRAERVDRYQGVDSRGDTIYLGAASSARRLRIYNKAAEQAITGMEWTRVELQSRKPHAELVRSALDSSNYHPRTISAIITGFADFPTVPDWKSVFIESAITLVAPPKDKNGTLDWLLNTVAPCLAKAQHSKPGGSVLSDFMARYRDEYKKLNNSLPL